MTVGTYSPWEPTAKLQSDAVGSATRGASAPTEGGEGRGHIVAAPTQLVIIVTLRSKLSGAVYCYRSCLWWAAYVCVVVGLLP